MDEQTKLHLSKMIKEYDCKETTSEIRKLKHSKLIRQDVQTMLTLKKKYGRLEKQLLDQMICKKCSFLFNNYTHIFNKLTKDRIDLVLFDKFLNTLEKIENGDLDQHDASYEIGKLLKKIYVDSALRESEQNEKKRGKNSKKFKTGKNISWSEYKKMNS